MQLKLNEPLYVLSKKYYASGEVVVEFIVQNNQKLHATLALAFKDNKDGSPDYFELGKEYYLEFKPKET